MKSLAEKLVKVLASVENVEKSGWNSHQKYKYITEEDVLTAVKKALITNKVFIAQSSKILDVKEIDGTDPRTGATKKSFLTTVETTHTFIDGDSGESLSVMSTGQGHDSLDKGVYKAITGANKYFFMKTLMLSTGDDPENDSGQVDHSAKSFEGKPAVGANKAPQKNGARYPDMVPAATNDVMDF